jgi:hypothetical protein
MNSILRKVKDFSGEGCVTIILNTHRTAPDNKADAIALKNLIRTAEDRIRVDYYKSKPEGEALMARIHALAESIDHEQNLDSLILFVSKDFSEYTRLPIKVEPRVVIDETFSTRDLVRAMHKSGGYYVLVTDLEQARLIEAHNDSVIAEFGKPFPYKNVHLFSTNAAAVSNATKQATLAAEFFNRIDKEVLKVHRENPMPVVICADGSNYFEYLKVADRKEIYIGQVNQNRTAHQAMHIVNAAWKVVQAHLDEKNAARAGALEKSIGAGKIAVDHNDIWTAIRQGRGATLYVKPDLFIPGIIEGYTITPVESHERTRKGVVDDIIDEMIEENFRFGGDVVFLEGDALNKFNGMVLATRY